MPLIRKKDGTYVARFLTNGKQPGSVYRQETLGKIGAESAKAKYSELLATKTRKGQQKTPLTFSDFLTVFEERYTQTLAKKTQADQKAKFTSLKKLSVSKMLLSQIGPKDVVGAIKEIEKLPLAESTQFNYFNLLKTIFKRAHKWGFIRSDVWAETELTFKRPDNGTPKFFTQEEWARFITCLDDEDEWLVFEIQKKEKVQKISSGLLGLYKKRLKQHRLKLPVFKMLLYTCSRINEVLPLKWKHVDYNLNVINLFQTKQRKFKAFPLTEDIQEVLKEVGGYNGDDEAYIFTSDGEIPFDYQAVQNTFNLMKEKAFIPPEYTIHTIRHTAASWLTMAGTPTVAVQKLMGHADLESTAVYSHLSDTSLNGMAGKLGEAVRATAGAMAADSRSDSDAKVTPKEEETEEIRARLKGFKSLKAIQLQISKMGS